jgi:hypothetical protein
MATAQNRMLMVPGEPEKEFSVPVVAANQAGRAAGQITDAPADSSKTGKDWRKHLDGSLRKFTVYGNGDQHSSASTSAGSSAQGSSGASSGRAVAAQAATPAVAASAYHVGITAEARPGVTDHVSQVGDATDGVRNFR